MALFQQNPFSPPIVDMAPMPVDTASVLNREIAALATNYRAGIAELPLHIDPLNYHDYTPKRSALDNIQVAPQFLPRR